MANPIEFIDLSLGKEETARALRQACEEVGFFYLINHGLDLQLQEKVFEQCRLFFSLPLEEKVKSLQDKNNRGYTGFEEDILNPGGQSKGDTKEGYYIGQEISVDDERTKKPLHGPNNWPSAEKLPEWRETMMEYLKQCVQLLHRLLPLLALSLDLPEDYFLQPGFFDDPITSLRPLHYSNERSDPEKGVYGAGAHTDYGIFTFLATDGVPGLQICRKKDERPQVWEDVPPIPGAFTVNLGDLLERWSNNRFRSTLHRVVNIGKERYSLPFFIEPNFDCLIECLPTCTSNENPPRYAPITSGEYLLGRYKATMVRYSELGLASKGKTLSHPQEIAQQLPQVVSQQA
eukprot:TRINITY_DN1739_c0_g1_i3.p1 TRINITY_DN1739_c0_g1~~TRINITY_DN1739_c0_g1_i3.p1  ORF type:complete len:346 (+),score=92.87 TRINITY_DN1739_c0_g1_i3:87-1124(+)